MLLPPFLLGYSDERPEPSEPLAPRTPLGLEDVLRQGWQLFMQYPGGFVAFTVLVILVYGAISGASTFISASSPGGVSDLHDGALGIQSLLALTIGVPLTAGYYVVALKLARGEPVAFEDFFGGFRYWPAIVLASILITVLTALGFLLFLIPGIYLTVAYTLVIPCIVDGEMNVWQAMEISRRAITSRWFTTFFLILLLFAINLIGALALCMGLLVTIPLTYCTLTALYLDLIKRTPAS